MSEVRSHPAIACTGPSSGRWSGVRRARPPSGVPCHALSTLRYRTLGPLGAPCTFTTGGRASRAGCPHARVPQAYVTLPLLHRSIFGFDLCAHSTPSMPSMLRAPLRADRSHARPSVHQRCRRAQCANANQTKGKGMHARRTAPFPGSAPRHGTPTAPSPERPERPEPVCLDPRWCP